MKTNHMAICVGGAALLGAFACATARPTVALLNAREAYRTAGQGPASELKQSDLHDARVLLDQAEDAALHDSENWAMHRAYLAQRRAELADAQGKTAAARRAKQRPEKEMQAIKDKSGAAA